MKKAVILLIALVFGLMLNAYKSRGNYSRKMKPTMCISQTLDSIHWLVERHCDNRTESMGYDDGTVEKIVAKFNSLPTAVADSLLQAQYDYMVTLFEQERNRRAYAIADCYYALAKDDDPNLGALYLNDIVLSIERNDTTMLRRRICDLTAYSDRNNLDYDQDIAEAEHNMELVKRRIHFNNTPVSAYLNDDNLWLLHIRDLTPDQVGWIGHLDWLMVVSGSYICGMKEYSLKLNKTYASLQEPWYINLYEYTNRKNQLDERTKTFFVALGTEMGGSPNPQLLASSRQTIQNMHAQVSGELARKKYSYGKRIGGELITSAIDIGLNALLDRLSVTTQTAIRKEITLTLTQPELLEGYMNIVRVTSRSDRPWDAKTESAVIPVRYYKMHPEDGLYYIDQKNRPIWQSGMNRSKWDNEYKKVKASADAWKKGQNEWKKANKGKKPDFNEYCYFRNDSVTRVLMQRAENSLINLPL